MEEYLILKYMMDNNIHYGYKEAIDKVAGMHHIDSGSICRGEVYNMCKASDIYKEYKHRLNSDVKETDVYVALNKKYHKYYNLLNKWGISDIDKFIVEITMIDCFGL